MRAGSWSNRRRLAALGLAAALFTAGVGRATEPCPAGTRNMLEAAKRREADDLAGALRDYATLIESFPDSRCAAEAMVRLASGRYDRQGDADGARATARRLITAHPTTRFAAAAHGLLARIEIDEAEDTPALERARDQLRNVWLLFPPDQYPRLEDRAVARVRFGELSYRLGDDTAAAAAFLSVIEDEPASLQVARAHLGFATVLLAAGDWVAAAELLQEVVDRPGATGDDPAAPAAIAARRLTLIHRARLRPAAGEPSWTEARLLAADRLGLSKVQQVAASDDGRLLVGGGGGGELAMLSAAGEVERRTALGGLRGLFWSADGRAHGFTADEVRPLGDSAADRLSRPKDEGGKPLKDIKGAVAGPFGGWIVLAEKRYHRYDRRGAHDATRGDPSSLQAIDLALGPRRRVHLLDARADRVVRLDADLVPSRAASGAWKRPAALAVDALGRIYVLEQTTGVLVFGADGELETTLGRSLPGVTLKDPVDLAVDGAGRLFIADRGLKSVVVLE